MATCLEHAEFELGTDGGILEAVQAHGVVEILGTQTFASSAPGSVSMFCGTAWPQAQVRLERWDARPPEPGEEWEDIDEVPWLTVEGAGPIVASGFDPPEATEGISVDGLGRARVQVLARGRHHFDDEWQVFEPAEERWLLRWFPDPHARDALAGRPRQIAGGLRLHYRPSPWGQAFLGLGRTGWSEYLWGLPGFKQILTALRSIERPAVADDLPTAWGSPAGEQSTTLAYTWETPVSLGSTASADTAEKQRAVYEDLAAAAAMPAINTFADALTALQRLGLIATCSGPRQGLLVPNPMPRPVWEVLPVTERQRHWMQQRALYEVYRPLDRDIAQLLTWAPNHTITTSIERIAVRLGLPSEDVIGVLDLLTHVGEISLVAGERPLNNRSEVTIRYTRPRPGII